MLVNTGLKGEHARVVTMHVQRKVGVCAHLMSVLRNPQIWLAPKTWAESAENSAIDGVFVQTVDLSESGSAGCIDGGPLKPHIGGSVCPSTAVSSLPIHV